MQGVGGWEFGVGLILAEGARRGVWAGVRVCKCMAEATKLGSVEARWATGLGWKRAEEQWLLAAASIFSL